MCRKWSDFQKDNSGSYILIMHYFSCYCFFRKFWAKIVLYDTTTNAFIVCLLLLFLFCLFVNKQINNVLQHYVKSMNCKRYSNVTLFCFRATYFVGLQWMLTTLQYLELMFYILSHNVFLSLCQL